MNIFRLLIILLLTTAIYADNPEIVMFEIEKSDKVTPKKIEKFFERGGFKVESNRDMNIPFKKQFNKTGFEIYNLMLVYDPAISKKLVSKYENAGVFTPFTILIYQKKGEKNVHIGFLGAEAMKRITGHNDPLFDMLQNKSEKAVKTALPNAKRIEFNYSANKPVKKEWLTSFSIDSDPDEALDFKEEVEMVFEDGLKPIGFAMANFIDLDFELKEAGIEKYIFYDTYSLCKLKVIFTVSSIRPEAGVFAPCTMAIYQKKGSDKMFLVYPGVDNWIYTLGLNDPASLKELKKAQKDMIELIHKTAE